MKAPGGEPLVIVIVAPDATEGAPITRVSLGAGPTGIAPPHPNRPIPQAVNTPTLVITHMRAL